MLEPFDCYTPGSRRLYTFEMHGETKLLAGEVRRTLDAIASAAPARIDKGQATRDDAARQAALWLAIAEDLERGPDNLTEANACSCGCLREFKVAGNAVHWSTKVAELRREIAGRRSAYPVEIAKGRLTRDQAQQQLERLEAVHDLYYRHGFGFDGTHDELRELGQVLMDRALTDSAPAAACS